MNFFYFECILIRQKKFVKLFTQNFPHYLAYFIFSYGLFMISCIHPLFLTENLPFFFVGNFINYMPNIINFHHFFAIKYIQNKKNPFYLIIVFRVSKGANFTISSSVIVSTTYQTLFSSVEQILSYSADRQTDRLTELKDLSFQNLHGLKHEILQKCDFFQIVILP